jgi:protein gp37
MNETKIEWADYTWNPVTGCLHGCKYCYARKIAKRFGGWDYSSGHVRMNIAEDKTYIALDGEVFHNWGCNVYENNGYKVAELEHPYLIERGCKTTKAPYPFGFSPTFHKYRLHEPQEVKKPQRIFVVSMGDLFGEWIPDEWIEEVFNVAMETNHQYLFLTKNPKRYDKAIDYYANEERGLGQEYWDNFWFGTTVTCQEDVHKVSDLLTFPEGHKFLSIEPLLGEVDLTHIGGAFGWGRRDALNGLHYIRANATECGCDWECEKINKLDWVIIGQQTNPDKPPKDEWVQSIIDQCRAANVPVFVKSPLYEKFPIQEWPEGLRKECETL